MSAKFVALRRGPLWLKLTTVIVVAIMVKLSWPPAEYSIGAFVVFGLMVAWLVGVYLEPRLVDFIPRREPWGLVLTAVFGVAGLMGLLAVVKPLLQGLEPLTAGLLQSAILGLYMTLIAPMLFKLCRLSRISN